MKIVFFSFPFAGHVYPNLPLLLELLKKKVELIIFGSEIYLSDHLFGENLLFESYPKYIMDFCKISSNCDYNLNNAANQYYSYIFDENLVQMREYKISEITHLFFEQYYEKLKDFHPDCILCDSYAFYAQEITSKINVKCIELNCSTWEPEDISKSKSWQDFLSNILVQEVDNPPSVERILMINRKINRLRKKLAYTYEISEIDKRLYAYHCEVLQDESESVSVSKYYLGFDFQNRLNIKKDGSIYVSRGTMSDAYGVQILQKTLQALGKIDAQIIASFGNNKVAESIINNQTCPQNVKAMLYCNQHEYLSRASIFITHGGITGVREALLNRTPMLVIPTNFLDYQVGKALEKAHAGILIENRPLDKDEIEYKIYEILAHIDEYTDGVNYIANELTKRWNEAGIHNLLDEIGM